MVENSGYIPMVGSENKRVTMPSYLTDLIGIPLVYAGLKTLDVFFGTEARTLSAQLFDEYFIPKPAEDYSFFENLNNFVGWTWPLVPIAGFYLYDFFINRIRKLPSRLRKLPNRMPEIERIATEHTPKELGYLREGYSPADILDGKHLK
ncbi:hypothetical protein HYW76_05730 [Candidatus Pacearchaeota archaeon]|nr:hypothetical protein [Candidatus Pacearchaeota archaeon]